MGGVKNAKSKLNKTLMFIIQLLNQNNVNNWFIAYGTLLGIIRDDSCIDGDDDVDIIIDKKYYDIVKQLLVEKKFEIEYGRDINKSRNILKTKDNNNYCSVDFYMASIDEKGNFDDTWEKVKWSECYKENNKLVEYMWNENVLYLPFNYEKKLINRYGENWRTPRKNYKGPLPRKKLL